MKIAVIKLGARITWDTDAAVGPGEAISICKALTQGGAEVHVFTKILPKDTLNQSIIWHDILADTDTSGLDSLLIINGNANFFGGVEDRSQILNYSIVNNFKGSVAYAMCDPELPMLQIWPNVSAKGWNYAEADVLVTRRDITVLSQPTDCAQVNINWIKKKAVPIRGVLHFPFERFPLLNEWLPPQEDPPIDLLYGGTARGGRRIPNLYKWYWNLGEGDLNIEIFGSIDESDFTSHPKLQKELSVDVLYANGRVVHRPKFSGKVKYNKVLPKMNSALAHMVTGDPSYEALNIIPQRTYECIAAGNVVFIDAAMDKSRRIYPVGSIAHEFLYVESKHELSSRLYNLKSDKLLREEIIASQLSATNFNAEQFCTSLVDTMAGL